MNDPPTVGEAQEVLREILARPEFQPPAETLLSKLLDQLREWRDEFLMWVIRQLGLGEGAGEVIGWIVIGVLVLALAAVLFFVLRSFLRAAREGSQRGGRPLDLAEVEGPASVRARAALEAARRAAERGDLGPAMKSLYLGAVYTLDGKGYLRFADRKTAGEYALELERGAPRDAWRTLVRAFQPVAFGGRPATPTSWSTMRAAADELGVPE